ncbi:MAG: PqqD family protein [Planctomycetota bacterium]
MATAFTTPAWLAPDAALACPRPAEHAFTEPAGEELVVMHRRSGESFRLNPTAALVWRALDDADSVDDVVEQLAESFDVDRDRATDDVLSLLSFWAAHRLLADTPDNGDA